MSKDNGTDCNAFLIGSFCLYSFAHFGRRNGRHSRTRELAFREYCTTDIVRVGYNDNGRQLFIISTISYKVHDFWPIFITDAGTVL